MKDNIIAGIILFVGLIFFIIGWGLCEKVTFKKHDVKYCIECHEIKLVGSIKENPNER